MSFESNTVYNLIKDEIRAQFDNEKINDWYCGNCALNILEVLNATGYVIVKNEGKI